MGGNAGMGRRRGTIGCVAITVVGVLGLTSPGAGAGGGPASPPVLGVTPTSTPDAPVVLTPGVPVTVTVSNAAGSRSTAALVTSLSGDGFTVVDDRCTGTALGPRRSCTVTVTFPGSAPETARVATLQVAGKVAGRVAPVVVSLQVAAAAPPPVEPPPTPPPPVEPPPPPPPVEPPPPPPPPAEPPTPQPPSAIVLSGAVVDENVPGAVIGRITVVDPDQDGGHQLEVSDPRFDVVDGTLLLRTGVAFDAELDGRSVFLTLTATDRDGLQLASTAVVTVNDINEAPGLRVRVFAPNVSGSTPGVAFASVFPTDPDVDDVVTIRLTDPRFELAGSAIRLRPGQSIDPATEPRVSFEVVATDRGGLSARSTVQVTITA